jgi:hypothetical protein
MKKLVLFGSIIFVLSANTFGQVRKVIGKPVSSDHYTYQSNDFEKDFETMYTYNDNDQLIKEVSYSSSGNITDSTLISYDANHRIISSRSFTDDTLSYSKIWVYDEPAKEIEIYTIAGASDTTVRITYMGVNDFDETAKFYSSESFLDEMLGATLINCDTILIYGNVEIFSLETMVKVYPKYENGTPVSAKIDMGHLNLEEMLEIPGLEADISMDFQFTYYRDKLLNVKGTITVSTSLFPISIPDAIKLTNQYNDNDLLVESKMEINIAIMGTNYFYTGMRQSYDYESGSNDVFVMTEEHSENGVTWITDGKTYYFYDAVAIKTINNAMLSVSQNTPNPANDQTLITYSVPEVGQVTFSVYSMTGQLISSQSTTAKTGENTLEFKTNTLSSGLYFYTMEFNGHRIVKKMSVKR